jgi:hypothetical protein
MLLVGIDISQGSQHSPKEVHWFLTFVVSADFVVSGSDNTMTTKKSIPRGNTEMEIRDNKQPIPATTTIVKP